jgi:hypothetical protein
MYRFGHNDWVKYGWGPDLLKTFTRGDHLNIDFTNDGIFPREMSSLDAAKYTVDVITKNYPAPYNLMCSGGTDSQVMLWAWKISGVPFNLISIRYVTNGVWYNDFDLVKLIDFAKTHNIEINFLDFDVINFVENDLFDVAKKFECDSPQISTYIQMSELIQEGTILFSGNFVFYTPSMGYSHLGLQHYDVWLEKNTSKRLIPFFLLHTPELGYSFRLRDNSVVKQMRQHIKDNLYLENGYPIIIPEDKFTGFEKIKEYYDQFQNRVTAKTRFIYSNMDSPRVFDLLFRYPLGVNKSIKMPQIKHLLPARI